MAYPKHYLFADDRREVAQFGFVVSHPARLRIIELLAYHGSLRKCDLMSKIDLSANSISSHLRYLERAQLIQLGRGQDATTGYRLNWARYTAYLEYFQRWMDAVAVGYKPAA